MCYAIPAKIMNIEGEIATVDYGGVIKKVNCSLMDDPQVEDYILIHAGFGIEKLNKKSAEEALEIINNELKRVSDKEYLDNNKQVEERLS